MPRTRKINVFLVALCGLFLLGVSPAPRRGADVHITFSGLICHVFEAGHAPRSVAVRGTNAMPHKAMLYLQEAAIESSEIPLTCDRGECTLDLTNTGLRFARAGSPSFTPGRSFDTITPHLRAVTNGEMAALREDVFEDVPLPGSLISASFLLPAGTLSAVAYDQLARYEPDFEGRGNRPFAREVMLDGHVPVGQLLVRRYGDDAWRRITFTDNIELRVVNEPELNPMLQHADLYYDLARIPLSTRPTIVLPAQRDHVVALGPDGAFCGNSTYP
ncbi:MAG TPA: hypothetical protein VNN08_08840 [Thermoanaerobaculia bacterium]|nr:hypothetical protein [Thermoanaerobaculia bacterium]